MSEAAEITGEAPASGDDWRLALGELKDDPTLADFKDVAGLAKAYKDTKSMVGSMIRIPSDDAGDEDRAAFRQKLIEKDLGLIPRPDPTDDTAMADFYKMLGRPEEAEGYTAIEGMANERFAEIARLAYDAGISDRQFQKVLKPLVEADMQSAEAQEAAAKKALGKLREEWSEAYEEKVARAARIAEATKAPKQLLKAIKDGRLDADSLRWLDSLAGSLGSESAELVKQVGTVDADTRSELESKRDELTRKIISDNLTPAEHQRLVAKLVNYNERLAMGR